MPDTTTVCGPMIRDLPVAERPRERLRLRGAEALANAELLAILLRTGGTGENVLSQAQRLLQRFGGLDGLGRASMADLCGVKGVGEAKAAQVIAALELGKRIMSMEPDRAVVRSPEDVFALLGAEMALLPQEHLRVILLNTRNQVLGVKEIYKGSVHSAVVRIAELFREAVREGCSGVIVVHNHPSGDPTPSAEDVALTRQIEQAGQLLAIELVDHVVIGRRRPASLKEMGVLASAR